ncbi:MAG: arginase family protein [bacterium]|nr:arginase family protein [bacterium]
MHSKKIIDALSYLEHAPRSEKISIFPIPFDWGADLGTDVAAGPRFMLDLGMEEMFEAAGIKTKVFPEIRVSRKHRKKFHKRPDDFHGDLCKVLGNIRDMVQSEVARTRAVVALGGDHTISIGTIAGACAALKGDLGVIWIDVHPDAHTHATSMSKNPNGMPTMALMGEGDTLLTDVVTTKVKKSNFLYLGPRDADRGELDNMRKHKVDYVTMMDIAEHGIKAALDGVHRLNKKVGNVWVSIDLDAIDQSVAPATSMATPGGFSHRDIVSLVTAIGKKCNVTGIDIVELTPSKDIGQKTGLLALELAAAAFGAKYNWYTRHMSQYGDWYSQQ